MDGESRWLGPRHHTWRRGGWSKNRIVAQKLEWAGYRHLWDPWCGDRSQAETVVQLSSCRLDRGWYSTHAESGRCLTAQQSPRQRGDEAGADETGRTQSGGVGSALREPCARGWSQVTEGPWVLTAPGQPGEQEWFSHPPRVQPVRGSSPRGHAGAPTLLPQTFQFFKRSQKSVLLHGRFWFPKQ